MWGRGREGYLRVINRIKTFENRNPTKTHNNKNGAINLGESSNTKGEEMNNLKSVCVSQTVVEGEFFYTSPNDLICHNSGDDKFLIGFLTHSCATEHLTNSKIIFKH